MTRGWLPIEEVADAVLAAAGTPTYVSDPIDGECLVTIEES